MTSQTKHVLVTLLVLLASAGTALAGVPVAILGSPGGGAAWNNDVQAKLLSTGFFSTVDIYAINTVTPTLAQLQNYVAVLVYSDSAAYADPVGLGNNLANYVDAGGGVVAAVFAVAGIPFSGRFATSDYWALEPLGQNEGTPLTLGTIHVPGSPLLTGVTSFNGGTNSYYGTGSPNAAATRVVDWSNGAPLVVTRVIGGHNRVDLNFYPPSNSVRADFWVSSTNGAQLMANALLYSAGLIGATSVPALSTWAMVGLAILLAGLGALLVRSTLASQG